MRLTGYSYPWDYVGDDHAASRAAELGLDVVAVAATYHGARVACPLHPSRRVIDVTGSACYLPVRESAWRGHRLRPSPPAWLGEDDAFGLARSRLADVGLDVDAWVVLTHNDSLGLEHPDLVVRNAFDDPYTYALCPASQDVRDFCVTLVEEIVRAGEPRGVVLEACGPMGIDHSGLHEKTELAQWTAIDRQLLALCFCDSCAHRYEDAGIDVDELAARVREGIGAGAASVDEALGTALARLVGSLRLDLASSLIRECVERIRAVRPETRVTLHASGEKWATGSFCAVTEPQALEGIDAAVAFGWDATSVDDSLRSLGLVAGEDRDLGVYLRLDRDWSTSTVEARVSTLRAAGVNELHLYHLGLWPRASWEIAAEIVRAAREERR